MTTKEKNSAEKSINEDGVIAIINKLKRIGYELTEPCENSILDEIDAYHKSNKQEVLDLAMDLGIDLSGLFIIKSERENEFWSVIFKYYDEFYEMLGDYESQEGVTFDHAVTTRVWPKVVQETVYSSSPPKEKCCGGKCKFVEPPKISVGLNNGLKLNVSNAGDDEVVYLQAGEHQRYTLKIINDELRKEVSKI